MPAPGAGMVRVVSARARHTGAMLGRRATAGMVAVALLSVALLTSCGSAPSAPALAREALRAFGSAPVKTIRGSFTDGVIPVAAKVTVASNGDAGGSGFFDHFPVKFLRVGGTTYVQGVWYWHWERLFQWPAWPGLGEQWVETGPDPVTSAFL